MSGSYTGINHGRKESINNGLPRKTVNGVVVE